MKVLSISNSMRLNNASNTYIGTSKPKTATYKSNTVSFNGLHQDVKLDPISAKRFHEIINNHFGILAYNEAQLVTLGFANYAKNVAKLNGKERPRVLFGSDANWPSFEKKYIIDMLLGQDIDVMHLPKCLRLGTYMVAAKKFNPDFVYRLFVNIPEHSFSSPDYNLYLQFFTKNGQMINKQAKQEIVDYMADIVKAGIYSKKLHSDAKLTVISGEECRLLNDKNNEIYKAANYDYDKFLIMLQNDESI